MTEQEYVQASNLAKVRIANTIMRDVLGGPEFGISDDEQAAIVQLLEKVQRKLFACVDTECES